jgi:hypothetical protein
MEHLEQALFQHYNNLGTYVLATNDFSKGLKKVKKEDAANFQWVSFRVKNLISSIGFDFDDDNPDVYKVIKKHNLEPNLIIQNPHNDKAQMYFFLKAPICYTEKGNQKIIEYYQAILNGMNKAFDCDINFKQRIGKNPNFNGGVKDKKTGIIYNDGFKLNSLSNKSYMLSDLSHFIDKTALKNKGKKQSIQGANEVLEVGNRNNSFFKYCCKIAKGRTHIFYENNDETGLLNLMLNCCYSLNDKLEVKDKLTDKEILSISISVSHYFFKTFDPSKAGINKGKEVNRGAYFLKVAHCTTKKDKQIVSALETHKRRKRTTEQKIKDAIYSLKADGLKVTQKAIAEVSGLNKNTLTSYKDLIKSLKSKKVIQPIKPTK